MVFWTVTFGEPLLSGITRKVRKLTLLSGSRYFPVGATFGTLRYDPYNSGSYIN